MQIRDSDPRAGTKLAWGTGTAPIREVLHLLKSERYSIVADIEYDYNGSQNPENRDREVLRSPPTGAPQ